MIIIELQEVAWHSHSTIDAIVRLCPKVSHTEHHPTLIAMLENTAIYIYIQ